MDTEKRLELIADSRRLLPAREGHGHAGVLLREGAA
jgi:hypothetical protein